jgi:hypothetical protein
MLATPPKKAIKLLAMAFGAALATTSGASASTTVNWSGANNFNDAQITFTGFEANKLVDIFGSGLYEACCNRGSTNFTLQIDLNNHWTTILQWSSTGDDTTHALGNLVPADISFSTGIVSGINLTSTPNGSPSSDHNFTDFNYVTYLSQQQYYDLHRSEYKNWNDFINCGDYDRYINHVTSFEFTDCDVSPPNGPPPSTTPLPGSLPLLVSGAGLFGAMRLRRKKKNLKG